MIFADLAPGSDIFLDANVLLYHFTAHSQFGPACTDLLERIERDEVKGSTSTHVLSEVAHRMMGIEAWLRFGWDFAGIVRRLKKHPALVQQLTHFHQALREIPTYGVRVLGVQPNLLDTAAGVSQATGLLHNDALVVAVMQAHGVTRLASHDADFDRVPGITRYAPG